MITKIIIITIAVIIGFVILMTILDKAKYKYRDSRLRRNIEAKRRENYRQVQSAEANTAALMAELKALPHDTASRLKCMEQHSDNIFVTEGWYWKYLSDTDYLDSVLPPLSEREAKIIIFGHKDAARLKGTLEVPTTMEFNGLSLRIAWITFNNPLITDGIPDEIKLGSAKNIERLQMPDSLWKMDIILHGFTKLKSFKFPNIHEASKEFYFSDCPELECVELSHEQSLFSFSGCPKLKRIIFPSYLDLLDCYKSYDYAIGKSEYNTHGYYDSWRSIFDKGGINPDSGGKVSIEFANGDTLSELSVPNPNEGKDALELFTSVSADLFPDQVKRIIFPKNMRLKISYPRLNAIEMYCEEKQEQWQILLNNFSALDSVIFPSEVWILEETKDEDSTDVIVDGKPYAYIRLTPGNKARYEAILGFRIYMPN